MPIKWEVLPGRLISQGARLKKGRANKISDLLRESSELEDSYKTSGDDEILVNLKQRRTELRTSLDSSYMRYRESFKHTIYEYSDKCSAYLARLIRVHRF